MPTTPLEERRGYCGNSASSSRVVAHGARYRQNRSCLRRPPPRRQRHREIGAVRSASSPTRPASVPVPAPVAASRAARLPAQLADRQPVPVGRASVSWSPSISSRTPVSIGSVSSRPAATATWPTAAAKVASTGPRRRHVGQRRVVLHRHGRQREPALPQLSSPAAPSTATSTGWAGAPGDLGQQPAADERPPRPPRARRRRPGGDLVVEAGHGQRARPRPQQQPGEHRHRRARRQAAGRPGDRLGERVRSTRNFIAALLLHGDCGGSHQARPVRQFVGGPQTDRPHPCFCSSFPG